MKSLDPGLFDRPAIVRAEADLRRALMREGGCGAMTVVYAIRDRYRELAEPRHPVTRWP